MTTPTTTRDALFDWLARRYLPYDGACPDALMWLGERPVGEQGERP